MNARSLLVPLSFSIIPHSRRLSSSPFSAVEDRPIAQRVDAAWEDQRRRRRRCVGSGSVVWRRALGHCKMRRREDKPVNPLVALFVRLCSVSEREERQVSALKYARVQEKRRAGRSTQGRFFRKEFFLSRRCLDNEENENKLKRRRHYRLSSLSPFFFFLFPGSTQPPLRASCPLRPPSSSSSMPLWPAVRPRTPSRASR